jgi:hypothetical protein
MKRKELFHKYRKTILSASIASFILSLFSFFTIIFLKVDGIKTGEKYGQSISINIKLIHEAMPQILITASITSLLIMICLFIIVVFIKLKIIYRFRFFQKHKNHLNTRNSTSDPDTNHSERKGLIADIKKLDKKYRKIIVNAFLFTPIAGFNFALLYTSVKTAHIISFTPDKQPIYFANRLLLGYITPHIIITAVVIFVTVSIVNFALYLIIHFRREHNIYVIYEIKRYFKEKRASKANQKNSSQDNDTNADDLTFKFKNNIMEHDIWMAFTERVNKVYSGGDRRATLKDTYPGRTAQSRKQFWVSTVLCGSVLR